MRRLILVLMALVVTEAISATTAPFKLPAYTTLRSSADGRGWLGDGLLPLAFAAAKARLGVLIAAAGWTHQHAIELSQTRILETWSRDDDELTVMIWRVSAGKSAFSFGISARSGNGKEH